MKFILLIAIICSVGLASLLTVILLYRHKKHAKAAQTHIGKVCKVNTELCPDGTVLLDGELWHARSLDKVPLDSNAVVVIVGSQDHLLMVRAHTPAN